MENTATVAAPGSLSSSTRVPGRSPWKKALRYFAIVLAVLGLVGLAAHLVWTASGSNEWSLVKDEGGVKVWTQKVPGESLVRVKANVQVKSKLAGMMLLLEDLESCVDAYCYDWKRLDQLPSAPGRSGTYVRFKFDIPGLKTREYVLFAERSQDAATKKVEINVISAANRLPRDACCVRVTHLHNNWKLTPLPNQTVDIEFMQDTDLGGLPYFLTNLALVEGTFEVMRDMQRLMDKDRYRNAQVPDIQEL